MRSKPHIPKGKDRVWSPRIVAEISPELFRKLQVIPHGLKRKAYTTLVEELVELIDRGGMMALAAVIDRKIGLGYNHLDEDYGKPTGSEEVDNGNDSSGNTGTDSRAEEGPKGTATANSEEDIPWVKDWSG